MAPTADTFGDTKSTVDLTINGTPYTGTNYFIQDYKCDSDHWKKFDFTDWKKIIKKKKKNIEYRITNIILTLTKK